MIDKYESQDHLGNVRATFGRDQNGDLEVFSYADYYPFGWKIPTRQANPNDYRFGYQGEFAEQEEETGWNAFELRMYDGRVGQWMTIDSMEEYWSPYTAMGNDPVNLTDPTGGVTETIYENAVTGERVEVQDGIDKIIRVNEEDFLTAIFFALELNWNGDVSNLPSPDLEIVDSYYDFYSTHNTYEGISLNNFLDYYLNKPRIAGAILTGTAPVPNGIRTVSAVSKLARFKGKPHKYIRSKLEENGFILAKKSKVGNETWKHADGSEVLIHPYGNQKTVVWKTGNNAHIHKYGPDGVKLNDRGLPSKIPSETHIGIPNPRNLPQVRNRPHGTGSQ